jgi:CDP-glucose 4,6-dehydratase
MSNSVQSVITAPFWRGKRVLVTGIAGFIAGHVARALADNGAEVVGIIRDATRVSSMDLLDLQRRTHLVYGSIVDYAVVERAINEYDVDTVLHLAAQAMVGAANRSPLSTFESNIKGTWNVLEACRQSRLVERVVVASSDKAYGDQPVLPYTEESTLNGRYPYDASKVCTEVIARSYATTFQLPLTITRCANIYGPGDLNWSRLIPGTFRSILMGENPIIRSDGTPERDYMFVDDAARAYLMLAERSSAAELCGQAFNFGTGTPVSALTLVQQMLAASGRNDLQPDIRGVGKTHGEIDRQYLDSRKAAQILGWQAQIGLADGIARAFTWYREHVGV